MRSAPGTLSKKARPPARRHDVNIPAADPAGEAPSQAAARRLLETIAKVESVVAVTAYTVVASALLLDVLGRELFGQGIWGAQRVAVYCTILAAYCGFGLASGSGSHLRPRIADHWVPAVHDRTMNRVADIVTFGVLMAIAYYAYVFAQESYELGTIVAVLDWKVWPMQSVIPAGFTLGAVRYLTFAIFPALRPVPPITQE